MPETAAQTIETPTDPAGEGHAHWPDLGARLDPGMSDRQLLGLPERYVALRDSVDRGYLGRRLEADATLLLRDLQHPDLPLPARLTAGRLLALLGDPRLDPLDPPLCAVPGGCVALGLDPGEVDAVMRRYAGLGLDRGWIEKETPRYQVTLAPYRIARHPVTNAEFACFLEASGYTEIPTSWPFGRFPDERANHPVYSVTPEAADTYAAWLSATTGRRFRLPSEAEWEYAAAGPEGRAFPWGEDFEPERANTLECGLLDTSPVGAFPGGASCFGALDMAGNVEEYVADTYAPYPSGAAVRDDLVGTVGRYRIARGGSFARFRDLARTRRRHGRYPRAIYAMGFRLAEDPQEHPQ